MADAVGDVLVVGLGMINNETHKNQNGVLFVPILLT